MSEIQSITGPIFTVEVPLFNALVQADCEIWPQETETSLYHTIP